MHHTAMPFTTAPRFRGADYDIRDCHYRAAIEAVDDLLHARQVGGGSTRELERLERLSEALVALARGVG